MSRLGSDTVERRLRAVRAPDETQAEQRAWRVVQTSYAGRTIVSRRRPRVRFALAPAVVALVGVLALTPAGATVHRWIDQALGVKHARPALFSLPSSGEILVAGRGGAWTVAADGAKRRLGPWDDAAWSPHALYVAVASHNQLSAVNLRGTPQWSIARPNVRLPRWFAPNGFRLAYLSAARMRVIAGDGTKDRQLAQDVLVVAPAWRPGHEYQLAYAGANGNVVVRDADTGRVAWSARLFGHPRMLSWSSDGTRLLVLTRDAALVLDAGGQQIARLPSPGGGSLLDGAISPDGRELALLSDGEVAVMHLGRHGAVQRRVFTGAGLRQLAWSPDGNWLVVGWPAADQWVFIHTSGRPRIIAVSRIAEQFGGSGPKGGFPRLQGWCCTASGGAG